MIGLRVNTPLVREHGVKKMKDGEMEGEKVKLQFTLRGSSISHMKISTTADLKHSEL